MASVIIMTSPLTEIDYSIADKRVRSFELRGKMLFDEDENIAVPGWKDKLVEFVKEQGMDRDKGTGLQAFIWGLIEEGLITEISYTPHEG